MYFFLRFHVMSVCLPVVVGESTGGGEERGNSTACITKNATVIIYVIVLEMFRW